MGNIKRLRYYSKNKCYNEIIMKKASDKQGYQIISLSKNKKKRWPLSTQGDIVQRKTEICIRQNDC